MISPLKLFLRLNKSITYTNWNTITNVKQSTAILNKSLCHTQVTKQEDTDTICHNLKTNPFYFHPSCTEETKSSIRESFKVIPDFIKEEEEDILLKEIEPHLKRLRYEYNHFDDAIHGYRETEINRWSKSTQSIINKLSRAAFPSGSQQLPQIHVLDLDKEGVIKPHIDSIRFCGDTVAGLCLLSDAVMRLVHEEQKDQIVDIMLLKRTLYYMTGCSRYKFTHEVLGEQESTFENIPIPRARRISIMCRNFPNNKDTL